MSERGVARLHYVTSELFPSLLEFSARAVARGNVQWKMGTIPLSLEGKIYIVT